MVSALSANSATTSSAFSQLAFIDCSDICTTDFNSYESNAFNECVDQNNECFNEIASPMGLEGNSMEHTISGSNVRPCNAFYPEHITHVDSQFTCFQLCTDRVNTFELDARSNTVVNRMNPFNICVERAETWPAIHGVSPQIQFTYNSVRDSGLPNSLAARIPLQSSLKIDNWRALSSNHLHDPWIIEMLEYGFPLQYTGPVPYSAVTSNHSSAINYPDHVKAYIDKEISEAAMVGPFREHPFPSSGHTNPLMSRPKSSPHQRRIIVDLSFPPNQGTNSYVQKSHVFSQYISHRLPTVDQALQRPALSA